MSTKFIGKFQQVDHENFDDFMKELGKQLLYFINSSYLEIKTIPKLNPYIRAGVNFALRKLSLATKPGLECTVNGDEWCITSKGIKDKDTKFKMGVEFDDVTVDGRKVKVIFIFNCN